MRVFCYLKLLTFKAEKLRIAYLFVVISCHSQFERKPTQAYVVQRVGLFDRWQRPHVTSMFFHVFDVIPSDMAGDLGIFLAIFWQPRLLLLTY